MAKPTGATTAGYCYYDLSDSDGRAHWFSIALPAHFYLETDDEATTEGHKKDGKLWDMYALCNCETETLDVMGISCSAGMYPIRYTPSDSGWQGGIGGSNIGGSLKKDATSTIHHKGYYTVVSICVYPTSTPTGDDLSILGFFIYEKQPVGSIEQTTTCSRTAADLPEANYQPCDSYLLKSLMSAGLSDLYNEAITRCNLVVIGNHSAS